MLVQEYIELLRMNGTVVNTTVVIAGAIGIIAARGVTKLKEYDDHKFDYHKCIQTKNWERSLLNRIGYVKRTCSTFGKVTISKFNDVKRSLLLMLLHKV